MLSCGPHNLGEETYGAIRRGLRIIDKRLYKLANGIAKSSDRFYCRNIRFPEKSLLIFLDAVSTLLEERFFYAVPTHPELLPQIRCDMVAMAKLLVDIHNNFVIHQKEKDKDNLCTFLNDMRKKTQFHTDSALHLCWMLVRTCDFLSPYFVRAAACINGLIFCANQMYYRVNSTICSKSETLIYGNKNMCFSASIRGSKIIEEDFVLGKPKIKMEDWVSLLEQHCKYADDLYKKFLCKDMKQKYRCTVHEVRQAINNSGGKIRPWMQVLVSKGVELVNVRSQDRVFSIDTLNEGETLQSSTFSLENTNEEVFCIAGPSDGNSMIQGAYIQTVSESHIEEGEVRLQDDDVAGPSNCSTLQQYQNMCDETKVAVESICCSSVVSPSYSDILSDLYSRNVSSSVKEAGNLQDNSVSSSTKEARDLQDSSSTQQCSDSVSPYSYRISSQRNEAEVNSCLLETTTPENQQCSYRSS
ncbi:hypothetical protein K6025_05040 [Ehrlichia sp. JZT12]